MSDPKDTNRLAQFKYSAMSNLVLQADKRFVSRRHDEATGDPESLAGRINIRDMGTRSRDDESAEQKRKAKGPAVERGKLDEGADILEREQRKRKRDGGMQAANFSLADLEIEDLRYRPRTAATRATYDLIITMVGNKLGDVPGHITVSAADAVLETLKTPDMKDLDKKKDIDDVLGVTMDSKEFNELVNLGKKISDYDNQDDDDKPAAALDGDDDSLDERAGVAVDFDDEEEDEDGIVRTHEVHDESETSDEEEDAFTERHGAEDAAAAGGADPDAVLDAQNGESGGMVIDSGGGSTKRRKQDDETVPAYEIDAFWLQRHIGEVFEDPHTQQEKAHSAFQILSDITEEGELRPLRDVENDLMELFDYEHHKLVSKLVINRDKIVWVTKLQRAEGDKARKAVEEEVVASGNRQILKELQTREQTQVNGDEPSEKKQKVNGDADVAMADAPAEKRSLQPRQLLNLSNFIFDQGSHLMTNTSVSLPQGTSKTAFKGYEEVKVPAPKKREHGERKNIPTSELPDWARTGFGSSKELNAIQTACYPSAFQGDGNMLVCAPTGSGKTNVAMLAMLREIGKHRDPETGEISLDDFKIIYIAPLKALVQEQVGNFGKRLEPYGIKVAELTGDRQLTKQQIADTQVIVTTPEKWDVITRKASDVSYTNLVRLICIDEIHLLHDERGPVLEAIVSRTIRKTEQTQEPVRIVGLSATLPNYRDVASFLRADPTKGVFHFDSTYRPCPLRQEFIGVTDKKPIKQLKTMNDVCYTKVMEQVGQHRNQTLIFVHSRKDTAKTARAIRDRALEEETIGQILRTDAASREILREEADQVANSDLKDLLPYGFGIHHAGLRREDRTAVEDLFADGSIQVLVCTATLAWGVNLPAHTVIIKGTQVYTPEKGRWAELSPQDVLQMLGRAGRPQYDKFGEGIIITTQGEMQYYLSLLNQQLPIESQFVGKLIENLNAEIVLGNIRSRDEGAEWLGYTYLFVRMLRSPGLYSVGADYDDDDALEQRRVDLIHSAATSLERCGLVKYEKKTGRLASTELGRIASHYYITHNSMMTYNQQIHEDMTDIEMFRVFSLSEEFKYIPVRQDEKLELAKLLARVPIPVKEGPDEPHAKINVLLQAYVARLAFNGLALMTDMVYVTQSGGRIMRAIFEICLKKGFASSARQALDMCKMIEKRMWPTMSPLRQFPEHGPEGVPKVSRDIVQKAERVGVPWQSYFDLDPPRMGELLGMPKVGRTVCYAVEHFPRLDVQAQVQPITRSMLRVELVITPKFTWNEYVHGQSELFWIMIEDTDGEQLLYHDQFLLRKEYAESEMNEHLVELAIPLTEPMPPVYYIHVVSDRWMKAQYRLPLVLFKLVLPEKFQAPTQLLNLQPLTMSALKKPEYEELYSDWQRFNRIQTQVFNSLFTTDDNVFVGAPTGSGKTACAEFALLRHWDQKETGKAIYIAPFQELVDNMFVFWQKRFSSIGDGKTIVKLTEELSVDLKLLDQADLVLATPTQWDIVSRNWQRRPNVRNVKLVIADEIQMIGGHAGHIFETVVSRMQTIALQMQNGLRIIGLGVPISNARDVGEWIGCSKHNIFNFSPASRPIPLELHIQSFTIPHFPSLMLAMVKPMYEYLLQLSPDKPAMVFLPGRKQVRATARDLLNVCYADDNEDRFLHATVEELSNILNRLNEKALAESISHGIGYFHEGLSSFDKQAVQYLYQKGAIQVLLASRDCCWGISSNAHLVVVMGTQYFEGREHRYLDYRISEILQMFGKSGRPTEDKASKGVLMVPAVKRDYYRKFLNEALPVESQMQNYLPDAFVTEISAKVITSSQDAVDWTTYTFFYRRLLANPSYYGMTDVTHEGLSSHLSELVESTVKELGEAKLIEFDEDEDTITPLNPAMIAAYYNISFITMQTFLLSLTSKVKHKALLEIVTSATEFEGIAISRRESQILKRVYDRVPLKLAEPNFESPAFKAFILVQAHFSRMQLPVDLLKDQELILKKILNLLSACVDILSSEGHINALRAMEMSQFVVQAMWDKDSPLKQIPHFTDEVVKVARSFKINDIDEFMEAMDPEENKDYKKLMARLALDQQQLRDAAAFTNEKYPNIDVNFEIDEPGEIVAGAPAYLSINIEREIDEAFDPKVHAPFFPVAKNESWWLVVAEESTRSLLAIKRVNFGAKWSNKLEYIVPTAGKHELTLYVISDSYVGVDQAPTFEIEAAEGEDEDEDEEDDDMEE